MVAISIPNLPTKEELLDRSEHLALAIEAQFREWLLLHLMAGDFSAELLLQFVRTSQKFDELKLKKAMLINQERQLDQKETAANDLRDYNNRDLDLRARELDIKAQLAAAKTQQAITEVQELKIKSRETAVKEKRLEFQISQANAKPSSRPAPEPKREAASARPLSPFEPTTEELVAMEWDLRSFLHFGDLRPFDWYTGLRTIFFPDRSTHPEPPIPHFPDPPVIGLAARPDGFVIMHTPVSELPEGWEEELGKPLEKLPYTPVKATVENGQVQWQHFIQPAYPHTDFPYNTALPKGWAWGDSIPGMPEEFA